MSCYLFVHFRETTAPDGEQVYFGISRDGFHWETVNGGRPVRWCYYGDKGARDFTIVFCRHTQKYYIIGTDLSLSYGMRNQYHHSWEEISRNGSKAFSIWESKDLVNWSDQRLVEIGNEEFGCMWAPDVIYDEGRDEYLIHWSSSHKRNNYGDKAIYYSWTKDFQHFSEPELLYEKKTGGGVIDSAMYEENGCFYMFVKSEDNPARIQLLKSLSITGPFEIVDGFSKSMLTIEVGKYEAPAAIKLDDGKWVLFLDYYSAPGAQQGYVPFVSDDIESGIFVRADEAFSFPYGFKHGTVLKITDEDYKRIREHKFEYEDGR